MADPWRTGHRTNFTCYSIGYTMMLFFFLILIPIFFYVYLKIVIENLSFYHIFINYLKNKYTSITEKRRAIVLEKHFSFRITLFQLCTMRNKGVGLSFSSENLSVGKWMTKICYGLCQTNYTSRTKRRYTSVDPSNILGYPSKS